MESSKSSSFRNVKLRNSKLRKAVQKIRFYSENFKNALI